MKGLQTLMKKVEEMGKFQAEVGWLDSAKYPDGTPVALVAQTQEYGSTKQHIPPRPFVRPTIAAQNNEWSRQMGLGVRAVARGNITPVNVFTAIGELAAGDVRQTITSITSPPLEESTKKARAREGLETEKPLQATGLMLASCTSVVKEK